MNAIANFVATTQHNAHAEFLLPGNIIPNFWYNKFQDQSGGPDLVAITILSEIVFHTRRIGYTNTHNNYSKVIDNAVVISYEFLENKFNLGTERIRRAFVRLEQQDALKREVRNVKLEDGTRANQLFVYVNNEFFQSCLWDKVAEIDLRYERKSSIPSPHKCGDHIRNEDYNYINRSTGSNFNKKEIEIKFEEKIPQNSVGVLHEPKNREINISDASEFNKNKSLMDFYPLNDEDFRMLQSKSGRDFTLNAMNEILKDVSRKKPDWSCYSKKGFISYMSEILRCEKRDAVKISSEGFRINNNLTKEEKELKEMERFLSDIEYSLEISPEWHFKKKLASVLKPSIAYKLLKSYKGCYVEGGIFNIDVTRDVELSGREREIILAQARATHENICSKEGSISISDIKFNIVIKEKCFVKEESRVLLGVWGNIRKRLRNYFGSSGDGMDESWFSKLFADIDEESRVVKLRAPNSFMREWINNHYGAIIERVCAIEGYSFLEVET